VTNGIRIKILSIPRHNPNTYHIYHILQPSLWPIVTSIGAFALVLSLVNWFAYQSGFTQRALLLNSALFLIVALYYWWSDVSSESGEHTDAVVRGLKMGMLLFILSEVMFFLSFFWAFFHASLSPAIEIGCTWPPLGIDALAINPGKVPLLNTLLLLSSGVFVTCAHKALHLESELAGLTSSFRHFKKYVRLDDLTSVLTSVLLLRRYSVHYLVVGLSYLIYTVVLAVAFTLVQAYEYVGSAFTISDSVYGSTFFLMTGFHGFHVIIGTVFLLISLIRILNNITFYKLSTGLECAIWYWHFVDVVWLCLFVALYWWGFRVIEEPLNAKSLPQAGGLWKWHNNNPSY